MNAVILQEETLILQEIEEEREDHTVDLTAQTKEEEEVVEAERTLYLQEASTQEEVALISQEEAEEATVDQREK